jgi:hypothetical protein
VLTPARGVRLRPGVQCAVMEACGNLSHVVLSVAAQLPEKERKVAEYGSGGSVFATRNVQLQVKLYTS